eukprot:TRINITY_DN33353_c0_g1_i1.p1 TRINITY_DN33353_c0_g1~~TRINITY_DN33353_c0_g1_i1.p1  ORF type:complete len:552 (+),score=82.79 TRINITY_DN33353_c0_g1_i1:65-1720(+)
MKKQTTLTGHRRLSPHVNAKFLDGEESEVDEYAASIAALVKEDIVDMIRRMDASFQKQELLIRESLMSLSCNSKGEKVDLHLQNSYDEEVVETKDVTGQAKRVSTSERILPKDMQASMKNRASQAAELDTENHAKSKDEAAADGVSRFRQFMRVQVLKSRCFDIVSGFLIMSNVVFIGIEVTSTSWVPSNQISPVFVFCNAAFTAAFSLELLVKMCGLGCSDFCCGPEWSWNVFDCCVVISSLLDLLWSMVASTGAGVSVSQMRILRILRIARLLRGMRIAKIARTVSSLRCLLISIINTLRAMIWVVVLLFFVFYGFGICFTQAVADYCRQEAVLSQNDENATPVCPSQDMVIFWGSLPTSMVTLFKAITGGISWHEVVVPLEEASSIVYVLFIVYIGVGFFVILNVVTAIFCNSAIESARVDKDVAIALHLAQKKQMAFTLESYFRDLDHDGSGQINIFEFENSLADEKMQALLESMDIDTGDAWALFELLDVDRSGLVDVTELVDGCLRYKGGAKATQMAQVIIQSQVNTSKLNRIEQMLKATGHKDE